MSFTVAIVGRPNVGKSTLYNRLTGTKHALVDDQPGVTRDWKMGAGHIGPMDFNVIDTAGLDDNGKDSLERRMFTQTERALERADVALFVVDARAGITPQDEAFSQWLRRTGKPMLLVVNKAEGGKASASIHDAYKLGFGEPVAISAAHGDGLIDLYAALEPWWKDRDQPEEKTRRRDRDKDKTAAEGEGEEGDDLWEGEEVGDEVPISIAIIGRPNAGKSTLLNQLVGEERVLTGPEAGITRDAIAEDFVYKGRNIKVVDTAGIRRRSNVQEGLEKLAVQDALRVIRYANVVIMLVDAEVALEKQDLHLISLVEKEGRAVIIGINKWDLIDDKNEYLRITEARIAAVIPQVKGIRVVPLSAKLGKHVEKLMDAALETYGTWNRRLSTGAINRWLDGALQRHSPPIVKNKRIKIRYMTQIKSRPPTFAMFTNNIEEFPDSYERYLVNGIREAFDMPGIPIRMQLRKGKNPYADKKK
ncbi:MAG: ribosome biogenesis GTPase Der [Alphaproteobacteria bacterium]|nr:ribosome biogenesis GTPase Der [Alphaproteobacteria bacterium]